MDLPEAIAQSHPELSSGSHNACRALNPQADTVCRGCNTGQLDRNCWEASVTPCCHRTRDACEVCPVYVAATRAQSHAQAARLTLRSGTIIEGRIWLRNGQRLSDALNLGDRAYIPVTTATVHNPAYTGSPPDRRDVVFVARDAVALVYPLDGAPEGRTEPPAA